MPALFKASPNEWYRWKNDLKTKKDIRILYSIDPSSFPLGTGPKPEEIWHDGYYPVVWTNVKYKMLYMNMGHNDLNSPATGKDSETFANDTQNKLMINALLYFGRGAATPVRGATAPGAKGKGAKTFRQGGSPAVRKAASGPAYQMTGRRVAGKGIR
jgi:hypothetical protein